jgi:hypothetical protein
MQLKQRRRPGVVSEMLPTIQYSPLVYDEKGEYLPTDFNPFLICGRPIFDKTECAV